MGLFERFKTRKFWLHTGVVVLGIIALRMVVYGYIFLGGPYDQAVASHSKSPARNGEQTYRICFTCTMNIRYGNGVSRYSFTIDVDSQIRRERFDVTVRKPTESEIYEVEFKRRDGGL